jgi:hypothetical protein
MFQHHKKKGRKVLRLGLGNVFFVTFAAMLGIMGVIGLAKLISGKNLPLISPVSNWIVTSWKAAA